MSGVTRTYFSLLFILDIYEYYILYTTSLVCAASCFYEYFLPPHYTHAVTILPLVFSVLIPQPSPTREHNRAKREIIRETGGSTRRFFEGFVRATL